MKRHAKLTDAVHRIWSNKGFLSTLLLPLSWLTHWVVNRKIRRHTQHPDLVWNSPVPVVIVGNIYVGGTGKTPVVMALVNALTQRGWKPGVISRGYGVNIGPQASTGQGDLDPRQFGDEPALIASNTGVPVAVHPSRVKAVQALLHDYPFVDVIVADDGLQHLALGRDAEIVVQDTRGIGNGRLLPAGPLREPATKLTRVNVVITNTHHDSTRHGQDPLSRQPDKASLGPTPAHSTRTDNLPAKVTMTLVPHDVVHVNSDEHESWSTWLHTHRGTPLGAVAAIGHPDRFFNMLRHEGLILDQTLALPDHTAYSASTLDGFNATTILMTSKDAVKCRSLNDDRLWAVHVTPHFSNTQWIDVLHDTLSTAAQDKRRDCVPCPTLN